MSDPKKILSSTFKQVSAAQGWKGQPPPNARHEMSGGEHQFVVVRGPDARQTDGAIHVITADGQSHQAAIGKTGAIGKVYSRDARQDLAGGATNLAKAAEQNGTSAEAASMHMRAANAHAIAGNEKQAEHHRQQAQAAAAKAIEGGATGGDDRKRDDHGRFA